VADCTGRPVQRPASGSTEVGGVTATPNIMCRWVDRSAAEEVRTVPNGKCFHEVGDRLFPTYGNTSDGTDRKKPSFI